MKTKTVTLSTNTKVSSKTLREAPEKSDTGICRRKLGFLMKRAFLAVKRLFLSSRRLTLS
ncbi:MAG TPA: hypothetical protein DCW60_04595 [Sutterella sp.]|nr:hypothetical protein [Sutterella sp.]